MSILRTVLPLILLTGCFRVGEELEPQINPVVQDRYLKSLPEPFAHVAGNLDWEKEARIGMGFAKELDLYQAITAFKRASFLLPPDDTQARLQLDYDVFLAYYLGGKYQETLYTFETSSLRTVTPLFTPYHDLLVMLYDSHIHLDQQDDADAIAAHLAAYDPATAQKLTLSTQLLKGDIPALEKEAPSHPEIASLLTTYKEQKKSTFTAQTLNAFLPGAGYLYVGQTQSALTAFALNGLFIWASVYFFQHGNIAAGAIFTSFEAGWYFGGIYGAGQEAKLYNERLYERTASPLMNSERYFPILMLKYGF